jgi:hypothetical protein
LAEIDWSSFASRRSNKSASAADVGFLDSIVALAGVPAVAIASTIAISAIPPGETSSTRITDGMSSLLFGVSHCIKPAAATRVLAQLAAYTRPGEKSDLSQISQNPCYHPA